MTTITEATISALTNYSPLTGLVGNNIYNIEMSYGTTFPAIAVQKISNIRENTMADSGGNGVDNARMRLSIYDEDLSDCEAVAEQARLALKNAETTNFKAIRVFENDLFNVDSKLYQIIVDYSIWYRY